MIFNLNIVDFSKKQEITLSQAVIAKSRLILIGENSFVARNCLQLKMCAKTLLYDLTKVNMNLTNCQDIFTNLRNLLDLLLKRITAEYKT